MLAPPTVEQDLNAEVEVNRVDDMAAEAEEGHAFGNRQDGTTPEGNEEAPEAVDKDDDDVTVIVLDHTPEDANGQRLMISWTGEAGPQVEERRRAIMLRELQRVQRTSFLHFMILCLIPTVLLFIVIATVISEDEECFSDATVCHKEARSFINAFTTRCVCEAIAVPRSP